MLQLSLLTPYIQHQYLAAVGNGRELFHALNLGRKSPSACTPSPWACLWRGCSASTCPGVPLAPPSRSSSSTSRTLAPASRSLQVMPDLISCLPWIPCLQARISVPVRVHAEWSSPPSSMLRCFVLFCCLHGATVAGVVSPCRSIGGAVRTAA
ncbi:uncharacterized protein [Aegilops tauschii subsp. strangulata]|uniref:uncharacterized protein isoform X1 n=1 Tax=Aegilops tauschii subsp. strangulata TaxID=200361 RepID=UPI003CC8BBB1